MPLIVSFFKEKEIKSNENFVLAELGGTLKS